MKRSSLNGGGESAVADHDRVSHAGEAEGGYICAIVSEGSATTLKARIYREELRASGLPEDEVKQRIAAAYRDGRLSAPRKPGIVYMLAPENYAWNAITKKLWTHPPHYMFYVPFATQEAMGDPIGPATPVVGWPGQPDAVIIVMAAAKH